MNERADLLAQLKDLRRMVVKLSAYLPFTDATSRYLDWLDSTIERMESDR